ncbi:MAG: hypothetical protein NC200_07415, partial [Candidatus Gastranaerophilales bacterium]|nr:hypothetical protein [Candidatus Gastranaerophilales bacterium]
MTIVFGTASYADIGIPTLGEDSGYSATEVTSSDGTKTITRYKYNKDTNELTPQYHQLDVKKTEYGTGSKSETINVKFMDTTVPMTVRYDDSTTKTYQQEIKNQSVTAETLIDPAGTNTNHYIHTLDPIMINTGNITIDNAVFENNSVSYSLKSTTAEYKYVDVTATILRNEGVIEKLTADFIGNTIKGTNTKDSSAKYIAESQYVGLIFNTNKIGDITGNFVKNNVTLDSSSANTTMYFYGGSLIGNYAFNGTTAEVGNVTGNFINNKLVIKKSSFIEGSGFVGNYAFNATAKMGNITGDFINNTLTESDQSVGILGGGLIGNKSGIKSSGQTAYAEMGNITGDFINNSVTNLGYSYGDASLIGCGGYHSVMGDITGNFINNKAGTDSRLEKMIAVGTSYTNAIGASIGNITGDFISNTYKIIISASTSHGLTTLGNITGDFISNAVKENVLYVAATSSTGGSRSIVGDINANFIDNVSTSGSSYGNPIGTGLIRVAATAKTDNYAEVGNITGDFIGNTINKTYSFIYGAGFIGNYSCTGGSTKIGDITGNFINNSVDVVKSNYSGAGIIGTSSNGGLNNEIGNINSNFVNNKVGILNTYNAYGAGIVGVKTSNSAQGSIKNITGDFINNVVLAPVMGGGIVGNYANTNAIATIGNITSSFKNNQITSENSLYSGIVGNYSVNTAYAYIENIVGDFENNTLTSTGEDGAYIAYGGAITNYQDATSEAIIQSIQANFNNNTIIVNSTNDETKAYGGAIYNNGQLVIGIKNSSFINNSVQIQAGEAKGGAIYTESDIQVLANNASSLFSGNYTQIGGGEKEYNAIYVGSSDATLTLTATNNGVIQFNDNIDGVSGYNVNITGVGDSTGTVKMYNDIKNANVSIKDVNFDTADGNTHTYTFESLTSNANAKYIIDLDLTNKTADKFVTTAESSGIVTLDKLNIISGTFDEITDKSFKVQILQTPSDKLQLALSDYVKSQMGNKEYIVGTSKEYTYDEIKADTNWKDIYYNYAQDVTFIGRMGLATTDTTNDSIGVDIYRSEYGDKVKDSVMGDTLKLVNQANISEKNFNFDASSDVYKVTENLGETAEGTLNINGVLSQVETIDPDTGEVTVTKNASTIDFNKKSGFELNNKTTLNVNSTNLTNSISTTNGSVVKSENENSVVNLKNTSLKNNISGGKGGAIYTAGDVNISAANTTVEISDNIDSTGTTAIYMANKDKTLTLNAKNNGTIVLANKIDGTQGYNVALTGDETSTIALSDNINNAKVSLSNTNLVLSKETLLDNSVSLDLNSGNMLLANNKIGTMHVPTLNLNGTTNIHVDADLTKETMDRITADNYNVKDGATLNVAGVNIIAPTTEKKVTIAFADSAIANSVTYSGEKSIVYSPIYKYTTNYVVNPEDGMGNFIFTRGGGSSGNASSAFKPSVLTTSVAQQTG